MSSEATDSVQGASVSSVPSIAMVDGGSLSCVGWDAVQYSENVNAAKNVTMNLMVVSVDVFGLCPVSL